MNSFVYRHKRKRNGKIIVSKTYRGRYKVNGKLYDISMGVTDKQVAQQKLNNILKEAEQEACGIIPPKSLRNASTTSLFVHLDKYIENLFALGRSPKYVENTNNRIKLLLRECGWNYPQDINAGSFESWRSRQKKAPKTLNDFLNAMMGFVNWMKKRQLLLIIPLDIVEKVETRGRERRKRRAFTWEELRRLFEVSGPRMPFYLTIFYTGLRRNEAESLLWGDIINLDTKSPYMTIRASTAKNHKKALMPLHENVVNVLRQIKPVDASSSSPVFTLRLHRLMEFKRDLAMAKIPFIDKHGFRVDIHSLRHTFATYLSAAGVAPRTAMELMRHSDLKLTMNTYTDASMLPSREAISRLPSLLEIGGTPDGTLIDTLNSDFSRLSASQPVSSDKKPESTITPDNRADRHDLTPTGTEGHSADLVGPVGLEPTTRGL